MQKINALFSAAREKAANKYLQAGIATSMALGTVAPAFAAGGGDDMVSGFTDTVTASKGQLWAVGAAVLGVCAICFLIGRGKKVSS